MKKISLLVLIVVIGIAAMGMASQPMKWVVMGGCPYTGTFEQALEAVYERNDKVASVKDEIFVYFKQKNCQEVEVPVGTHFDYMVFGNGVIEENVVADWSGFSPLPGNPRPPYKAYKYVVEKNGFKVVWFYFAKYCKNHGCQITVVEKPTTPPTWGGTPTPTATTVPVMPTPTTSIITFYEKKTNYGSKEVNIVGKEANKVTTTQDVMTLHFGIIHIPDDPTPAPTCSSNTPTPNPTCQPSPIPTTPETPIPTNPPQPTPTNPPPTQPPVPTNTPQPPPTVQPTCNPWPTAQPTFDKKGRG